MAETFKLINRSSFWGNNHLSRTAEGVVFNSDPYDMPSWLVLMGEAEARPIDESRDIIRQAVTLFPSCGKFVKLYMKKELEAGNLDTVKGLFAAFFNDLADVEMCQIYIDFLKISHQNQPGCYDAVVGGYEDCIKLVGVDFYSYPLWSEYINYVMNRKSHGTFAEAHTNSKVRSLYLEAINLCSANIENLWRDYCTFEQTVNLSNAEKLTAEKNKDFVVSRRASREFDQLTKQIPFDQLLPTLPEHGSAAFTAKQKKLWINFFRWELNNFDVFSAAAGQVVVTVKRLVYYLKKYINCFYFHPMCWIESVRIMESFWYRLSVGGAANNNNTNDGSCGGEMAFLNEQIRSFYHRCLNISVSDCIDIEIKCPSFICNDFVINFGYADFEKRFENYDAAIDVYEKLLKIEKIDEQINMTLVYMNYIKFVLQTKGIEASRKIFYRARLSKNIDGRVYIMAANIEHYFKSDSKDYEFDTSTKIFNLGLKRFHHDVNYINAYILNLSRLGNINAIRSLYENLLQNLKHDNLVEISEKTFNYDVDQVYFQVLLAFHKFECNYGKKDNKICSLENEIIEIANKHNFFNRVQVMLLQNHYSFCDSDLGSFKIDPKKNNTQLLKKSIVQPSEAHMIPFKPLIKRTNTITGTPVVALGGIFAVHKNIEILMSKLPPPHCYKGPFLNVNKLLTVVCSIKFDASLSKQEHKQSDNSKNDNKQNKVLTKKVHPNKMDLKCILNDLFFARQKY